MPHQHLPPPRPILSHRWTHYRGRRPLVVTGSRWAQAPAVVHQALDQMTPALGGVVLIHGGAPGVDSFAANWAKMHNVPMITCNAQWVRPNGTMDRSGGPRRNWAMCRLAARLAERQGMVGLLLAFPGGSGTSSCLRAGRTSGLSLNFADRNGIIHIPPGTDFSPPGSGGKAIQL